MTLFYFGTERLRRLPVRRYGKVVGLRRGFDNIS
jgi:hypothetical protein